MGTARLFLSQHQLIINSVFYFYGDAANSELAIQIASNIQQHWNEPSAKVNINKTWLDVRFEIMGIYESELNPEKVWYNTNPAYNFFRIEEFSPMHVSFVDGLGCNTGFFKLENLLQTSTTSAHEYGHTLGLEHPKKLDIRGRGIPGMMYPRGTICDPQYQYDALKNPGENGGTLAPWHRHVTQSDIDDLKLHKLKFDNNGFAVLGDFTSIYHSKYLPEE